MAKIIIAVDMDMDQWIADNGDLAPIAAPAAEPAPVAPPTAPTITPTLNLTQDQPKQVSPEVQNFYGKLDSLLAMYKANPSEDIVIEVGNLLHPQYGKSIREWLMADFMRKTAKARIKSDPQEAQANADYAIENTLKKARPGNLVGYMALEIAGKAREVIEAANPAPSGMSKNEWKLYRELEPYLKTLLQPDSLAQGTNVDKDLIKDVQDGVRTPVDAAYTQKMRVAYKDHPIPNDPKGRRRVEFAKDAFVDFISKAFAQQKKEFEQKLADPAQKQAIKNSFAFYRFWEQVGENPPVIRPKLNNEEEVYQWTTYLKEHGIEVPKEFLDPQSPVWFQGSMINKRKVTEKILNKIQNQMESRLNGSSSQPLPTRSKDFQKGQDQAQQSVPESEKLNEQEADPNREMANTFTTMLQQDDELDPEDQQVIEERLKLLMPFNETAPTVFQQNPKYRKAMETVLDLLYGEDSLPIAKNPQSDAATKQVLYTLGMDLLNRKPTQLFTSSPDLSSGIANDLNNMTFRHTSPDKIRNMGPAIENLKVKEKLAYREIFADIIDFLKNKYNYQDLLETVGMSSIASLNRFVRTANFLVNSSIIFLRG